MLGGGQKSVSVGIGLVNIAQHLHLHQQREEEKEDNDEEKSPSWNNLKAVLLCCRGGSEIWLVIRDGGKDWVCGVGRMACLRL